MSACLGQKVDGMLMWNIHQSVYEKDQSNGVFLIHNFNAHALKFPTFPFILDLHFCSRNFSS